MTNEEIIQALRCCEKEVCADGGLCPLFSDEDCIVHLREAAIDLIERLTAENVALREGASLGKVKHSQKQAYEKQIKFLQALANCQLSEIKKLQKNLCWKDLEVDAAEWKQERAEAERDALLEIAKNGRDCDTCKNCAVCVKPGTDVAHWCDRCEEKCRCFYGTMHRGTLRCVQTEWRWKGLLCKVGQRSDI
nr:MAG TPA: hypothetical protein [Bacteriophage sp.]